MENTSGGQLWHYQHNPSLQLNMGMVLGGFLFLKFKIESGSSMGSQMPSNFGSRIFFTFKVWSIPG
jgi:hypothetical protein